MFIYVLQHGFKGPPNSEVIGTRHVSTFCSCRKTVLTVNNDDTGTNEIKNTKFYLGHVSQQMREPPLEHMKHQLVLT
jgi:hypothetical protein